MVNYYGKKLKTEKQLQWIHKKIEQRKNRELLKKRIRKNRENRKRKPIVTPPFTVSKSVPQGILKSFIYEPKENHPDLYIFFDSINIPLRTLIQKELENLKGVKVSLTLQVEMEKGDDITTTDTPYFRSGPMTVTKLVQRPGLSNPLKHNGSNH